MDISILGSTGSIGTQTLDVVRDNPKLFRVRAITGNKNIDLLEKQAREFKPELVVSANEAAYQELKIKLSDTDIKVLGGDEGIIEAASIGADSVVVAVVGMVGIPATMAALKNSERVALASKEALVAAGSIIKQCERANKGTIIPVDSEHSAIFQSMQGDCPKKRIKRILLTASGGPFYGKTKSELKNVTVEEAIKHPNWDMGAKILVDSSTLVNKGLEMIEARWLFDIGADDIEVVVHRQSVLHSAVEFEDNGVIAQLGAPDMRLPIQYALTYPDRLPIKGNELDLISYGSLTFEKPDTDTFYALELARKALIAEGTLAAVFNGADEAAVELFLKGKISYLEITEAIDYAMSNHNNIINPSLDEIYKADKEAKEAVFRKFCK